MKQKPIKRWSGIVFEKSGNGKKTIPEVNIGLENY
jgi:hypothetical protein